MEPGIRRRIRLWRLIGRNQYHIHELELAKRNQLNRTFNDVHNLTATAVQEYTHQEYEYTDATVQQISDAFFTDHIISNTFGERFVSGGKTFMGLASYMFRANYNYDSKYYIGASVRTDGLLQPSERHPAGVHSGRISRLGVSLAKILERINY